MQNQRRPQQNQRRASNRPVQANYRRSRSRIRARRKKRLKIILAFVALLLLIVVLVGSCGNSNDDVNSFSDEFIQAAQQETEFERTLRTYTAKPTQEPVQEIVQATQAPTQIPTKVPAPTEAISIGKRNALSSAKSYLEIMAFSYIGLGKQLMYEGYTKEEAKYAVDNCGADWYEQAAKSARNYLDMMSFSRQGLIEQLEYEDFTREQAVYGVSQVGY